MDLFLASYVVVSQFSGKWCSPFLLRHRKTGELLVMKPIFDPNEAIKHILLQTKSSTENPLVVPLLRVIENVDAERLRLWIHQHGTTKREMKDAKVDAQLDYQSWKREIAVSTFRSGQDGGNKHKCACLLVAEYASGGSLYRAAQDHPHVLPDLFLQSLLLLHRVGEFFPELQHNDAHASNFLLLPTKETHLSYAVECLGARWTSTVATHGYRVVLWDPEWCHETTEEAKVNNHPEILISAYFDTFRLSESLKGVHSLRPSIREALSELSTSPTYATGPGEIIALHPWFVANRTISVD